MTTDSLTDAEARKKIASIDKGRAHYRWQHYDADWADTTLYHLVINTSFITIGQTVKTIVTALHQVEDETDNYNLKNSLGKIDYSCK